MRDPYSILGVQRDAGTDEIKAAWRSKAKTSHPDQNREDPTATQRFAEIGQAYDVLKDPAKRSRYDQQRSKMDAMKREQTIMQQREEARAAAERARQAKANAERVMADLARIEAEKAKAEKAAEMLNVKVEAARARAQSAEAQAANASADATASANASAKAQAQTQAQAQPQAAAKPETAKAAPDTAETAPPSRPASPDAADDAVSKIFGAAQTEQRQTDQRRGEDEASEDGNRSRGFALPVLGLISSLVRRIRKPAPPVLEKAPDIMVEATIAIDDLLQHNTISVQLSDGREVRLPLEAGYTDGSIARLSGKGLKVPSMLTGDVLVTLRVLKSPAFSVDGYDIHCVVPIKLEDAVLGCDTVIEGPQGPLDITVPAWTGSDQSIRIEGEGLPSGPDERGALVVEIRVVLWEKPDEKVTDLMKVMKHGLFL
ncbi:MULTISPECIES: DnaJ C-terminal domain-containing protein [Rhizobium/Agrobacterium group]|uniref:DnaJ C-terminal domain-containing protein n=1 Tax=Rhizobium/Agrobacterium group TaxID=227290 RepID=UPI000B3FC31D|nr:MULTISPECIES: DnaJ C-terminal domain-containing protein [Rhizobium/Agrobacterium group]MCF1482353.1 molecular chaperone DnaJ [Allorhizobium ampelinum]NSZ41869.1 DnaJ domain-containing protein [Agrobacterium vitis]NTA25578.1 DnaJ domain-containing protein [Allorhizobium ampelinum]OVE96288.1 molecular chaperone DnaJ [Allorhizobium ampelinum]